MTSDIMAALGGIGLFLLGMHMMTGGLRGLAGKQLRHVLARFTVTPLSGAVTGALTTALIQSSSATTVTAVGFVGAGLLTFPQALGIIFGANIGTTMTGWLVAIAGFKLDLGELVLPLVFAGALMRILGRGRLAEAGLALAGFSLLFIGIEAMKDGLAAFEGAVTPSDFPDDTLAGRLKLAAAGVAITIVTQSSSAGVATALAALGAGAISFPQAAALVIGMDVGTTATALLATLGGSAMTRRTGAAHVIYNVMTGGLAFALLPLASAIHTGTGPGDAQLSLVAFHTAFNLLGVALVLPFARQFARLIEALVPARGPELAWRLENALLRDFEAAASNARATVADLSAALSLRLAVQLGHPPPAGAPPWDGDGFRDALIRTQEFTGRIVPHGRAGAPEDRLASLVHALDHISRLRYRSQQTERIETLQRDRRLRRLAGLLAACAVRNAAPGNAEEMARKLNRLRRLMHRQRHILRNRLIAEAVQETIADEEAAARLDALRWLHRSAYHLWRIRWHLNLTAAGDAAAGSETRIEVSSGL
ncbi:Na/Pi cotransporter family protein [Roseobacteraceae bacterium NS-SX3]